MFSKLDSEPRDATGDQWKITEIHTHTHTPARAHKFPVSIEMWKRVIPVSRCNPNSTGGADIDKVREIQFQECVSL